MKTITSVDSVICKQTKNDALGIGIAAIAAIVLIAIDSQILPNTGLKPVFAKGIFAGIAIVSAVFFLINYFNHKSKSYRDELINKEKTFFEEALRRVQFPQRRKYEEYSRKITEVLHYCHRQEATIEKLRDTLKREDFSYLIAPLNRKIDIPSPKIYDVIEKEFEQLLLHIQTIGFGDYTKGLQGRIKIKLHAEEEIFLAKTMEIIKEKIKELEN